MSLITVAATQFACTPDRATNLASAERVVRAAHAQGAQVILLQELFESPYFCIDMDPKHFDLALPIEQNPAVRLCRKLARDLNVVLPVSVFERAGNVFYNSVALIDAARRTFPTARVTTRSFIFLRAIPVSKYGIRATAS
jgi:N-carbamoylputrescine amidase